MIDMPRQMIVPPGMELIVQRYHYAPGVLVGNTLYASGQVGRDDSLQVVPDLAAQFTQAFDNVGKVLQHAGFTFDDVVELETWFTDFPQDLGVFLPIKDRYFPGPGYPTWTGFGIKSFSMPGIAVEIKVIAVREGPAAS
jgi:enamine deaminase RidA (YjgF/YER057c/UK114 family)